MPRTTRRATSGAAIVVLDPRPPLAAVPALAYWTAQLPTPRSAIEIAGPGKLEVDGALLANAQFGGSGGDGSTVGIGAGPPYGINIINSRLKTEELRISGGVSDEKAKEIYPDGWKAPKPYLRIVPQPQG